MERTGIARTWLIGAVASVLVTLALGIAVTALWSAVQEHEHEHLARLIERESYATRSDLVRRLDAQFQALRRVARYWNDYAHLSHDQWQEDASIEISHFQGFETLLWSDRDRDVRYWTTVDQDFSLSRTPDARRWEELEPLLNDIDRASGERVLGPVRNAAGHALYRIQVPGRGPTASGVLVAVVDGTEQLAHLLEDQLPGHAITVTWDGETIYERDNAGTNQPDSWSAGGLIRLSVGPLWRVTHAPTAALGKDLQRPTLPGLLFAGWLVALMAGALVFQHTRVLERARAAERAEARYAELNRDLEQRVNARTTDLEIVSQSVAHDVRNGLNTLSLQRALIAGTVQDERIAQPLERMTAAIDEIIRVVERVQTYTNVAFADPAREEVDMEQLATSICDGLTRPPSAAIHVAPLPPCRVQPVLAEIALHNLVSNALKFSSEHESPRVEISAEQRGRLVVYVIRDNGPGFDQGVVDDVFKPFVRLDGNSGAGLGLGLAIVERVVRLHGGEVWVETEAGRGATFKFHFGEGSIVS
ncbi:MAG: HAMP domain-containing sensor histidine kinase [Gammaproteobacteria bacterium]